MASSPQRIHVLDDSSFAYIKAQIETGDHRTTKLALQDLCKFYRRGYRVPNNKLAGIEQQIIGALYLQDDEKVRRWALNAIARLGREAGCTEVLKHILGKYRHEAQTTAAAIAAVYRLAKNPDSLLQNSGFDPQMIILSALQHVDPTRLDLSALPVDVESATPDLLQLGLVLVGLDRAPANLLNPRHDNRQMVCALGSHHDRIVSQYSVWAITENPNLGVRDLGIDIRNIEQQPANVRSWVFQLLSMAPADARQYYEYVELGSRDPDAEARIGLSLGLGSSYFDGLETLVLDWLLSEVSAEVRQNLLDHVVKYSRNCPNYEELSLELYEKEALGSSIRQRMLGVAAGSPLYMKLRRIDYHGTGDLFGRGTQVTNNTFNIQGGVQGAAVSLGGSANSTGDVTNHYNPQTIEAIRSALSQAERSIHETDLEPSEKREALAHVEAAKIEPTPDKVGKAVTFLQKISSGVSAGTQIATGLAPVVSALAKAAGLGG